MTDSSNPVQSVTAKVVVVEVHDPDPQPLTRIRLTDRTGKVVEVKINID